MQQNHSNAWAKFVGNQSSFLDCCLLCRPAEQTKLNLWLRSSAKQHRNPCPATLPPSPPYTRISVRALIINFLIKLKGNSKRISGNSLSPREFQNNDIRELKQGRRRRQRERQKIGEKQLCTCITLFCTFLCRTA